MALAFLCAGVPTAAQPLQREPDSFKNRQRAIYEQTRREFDEQMHDAQRAAFDWGGWYSLNFMMFDDGVNSSRTFRHFAPRTYGARAFLGEIKRWAITVFLYFETIRATLCARGSQ